MVDAERFVDELKAAGAGFSAGQYKVFTVSIYCISCCSFSPPIYNGILPIVHNYGVTIVS